MIWLQSLKVFSVKVLKSLWYVSHKSLSLSLYALYLRSLNSINSLISFLLTLSDCALIPLLYLSCPSLICSHMVVIVAKVSVIAKVSVMVEVGEVGGCLASKTKYCHAGKGRCVIDTNQRASLVRCS